MRWADRVQLGWAVLSEDGWPGLRNAAWTLWTLAREPERVRSEPAFVQIEPTVVCNLRCTMCASPYLEREVKTLDLGHFACILEQLPRLRKISLVGIGEPTLNRQLFEMIRLTKRRRISIGFTTNATLLTPTTIAGILESAPDWLHVSIDGATKATFERIRVGARFEQVLENLRALTHTLGNRKTPVLTAWCVVMRENLEELPDVVELVHQVGIRRLSIQSLQNWGRPEWEARLKDRRVRNQMDRVAVQFQEASRRAKRLGVRLSHVNIPSLNGPRACNRPWKSAYITTDGHVTPCCLQGADPTVINFGNLFERPFQEIWNNEAYRRFRRELKSDQPPAICVGCPGYHAAADL